MGKIVSFGGAGRLVLLYGKWGQHILGRRLKQQVTPKRHISTKLLGITSRKFFIIIFPPSRGPPMSQRIERSCRNGMWITWLRFVLVCVCTLNVTLLNLSRVISAIFLVTVFCDCWLVSNIYCAPCTCVNNLPTYHILYFQALTGLYSVAIEFYDYVSVSTHIPNFIFPGTHRPTMFTSHWILWLRVCIFSNYPT
jgi:hypothetical protein